LYWIPTFPYGRKHYLTCPVCQHGKQIEKQEIEQFLNY
ncbi:MAG: zinc-ribbon domain-containing protein, partial [Streptococcus sp.]|nr:zinc-ribbon domain-containing protein [Streptococcus sp.]